MKHKTNCLTVMLHWVVLVLLSWTETVLCKCTNSDDVSFELTTGYVFSSPGNIIATKPGILSITECIRSCREDLQCQAVNYETGLCVLFASKPDSQPDALSKSQFPVFTLFAQKICLKNKHSCRRPWIFEIVKGQELVVNPKDRRHVLSRKECMELCLHEKRFVCRSSNYNSVTGECCLNDVDRFTLPGPHNADTEPNKQVEYLESNCVNEPIKMCDFTEISGKILKTVDVVYQDVESLHVCQNLCLQSKDFRCHTVDYGDTGGNICRLSHHTTSSLQHIDEPYLEMAKSTTYQLTACYNISVDCRGADMVARVHTNKMFSGKVYAKSRPNSCVMDVDNSLDFELHLGYHDLNCDVKQDAPGKFTTDIIIQHHDQIVTGQDVGLSVRCSYNLQNRSVGHGMELAVAGEPEPAHSEEAAFVISPTVTMRITDRKGDDIYTAQVGDALSLRFHILDDNSPYQIFVRELIALDGVDSSEILLIDSMGCPTDPTIMGPIVTVETTNGAQILEAPFDAFKFPTSDVVQFKALVTPCLPKCEPVVCHVEDYYGIARKVDSFGRRRRSIDRKLLEKSRRRRSMDPEIPLEKDEIVYQSIRIEDKFKFDKPSWKQQQHQPDSVQFSGSGSGALPDSSCMNMTGVAVAAVLLVSTQICFVMFCILLWHKRKSPAKEDKLEPVTGDSVSFPWNQFYRIS
ncbi:unnamed protein product [Bemisia tabaci]|uniref:Cuticlin-1 n=1 Tax=Bemisia tabaci TaxID=7038 RepID=A0A9P0CEF7_BEMTA|nr:unnamed protein product [Bemisia tabaci]